MFYALASSFLVASSSAAVVNIVASDDLNEATWTRTPYARVVSLSRGDKLQFLSSWRTHNVFLSDSNREGEASNNLSIFNDCDAAAAETDWNEVRSFDASAPTEFLLDTTDMDLGVYYAMCTARGGSHCEAGMRIQITLSAEGNSEPQTVGLAYAQRPLAWTTGMDYPDFVANVGDILRWNVNKDSHNLLLSRDASDDRCNEGLYSETLVPLVDGGDTEIFDYVIEAPGDYSFACFARASHCATMQFNVNVPAPEAPEQQKKGGGGKKQKTATAIGAFFLVALGSFAGYRRFKKSDVPELQQENNDEVEVEDVVVIHT